MEFKVDKGIKELGIKIKAIKIEGLDNRNTNLEEFNEWKNSEVNRLIDKYKDYNIKEDEIIEGFYKLHEKVGVPRRKNLPASENLIKLLIKRGELNYINKAVDIYNIISIDSKLCLGAHDIDKATGNITFKLCDGTEKFLPLGSEELKPVKDGEYAFVDDASDVLCWLDIRQVDKTKVTENTKNIIYFIIGNEFNSEEELDKVVSSIGDITTKFCGGKVTVLDI